MNGTSVEAVAFRRLVCAVIVRAVRDVRDGNGWRADAQDFLTSLACDDLLESLDLPSADVLLGRLPTPRRGELDQLEMLFLEN